MIFLSYCDMNDDPFELCVFPLMGVLSLGCLFWVSTGVREGCFFCVGLVPFLYSFGLFPRWFLLWALWSILDLYLITDTFWDFLLIIIQSGIHIVTFSFSWAFNSCVGIGQFLAKKNIHSPYEGSLVQMHSSDLIWLQCQWYSSMRCDWPILCWVITVWSRRKAQALKFLDLSTANPTTTNQRKAIAIILDPSLPIFKICRVGELWDMRYRPPSAISSTI